MANKKKEINQYVLKYIGEAMTARLREKGMSFYSFWRSNGFSAQTCHRVFNGTTSCNVATLVEYLDALDLELKIVPKDGGGN